MNFLQRTLTLALVVALAGAFDPWSYFDGGDLGDIIMEKPNDVGLCPSLISMMDNLSADNTFKCQPLPSHVKGKVPEFCNFAAVDTVRGCRGESNVTSCLGGALEALKDNQPYSDCMCHGYLENYAALWSVWTLACDSGSR